MNPRTFSLPAEYETRMESELNKRGFSLTEPRKLAEAVLKLSDHYTQNPDAASPWHEPWAQAASIAYYFPLNLARNRSVALEGARLGFFDGLRKQIDIGSGMGPAICAFRDYVEEAIALDVSREALELGHSLSTGRPHQSSVIESEARSAKRSFWLKDELEDEVGVMLTASYVLTELPTIPDWWLKADALVILEPSTHQDARRLQSYRTLLREKGFQIWAPCTHEGPCPLLVNSEKDWCHDRIHWTAPKWFEEMERHLPMKNRTLTFSYLLARRTPPPNEISKLARLVGDMLEEKGKTRQSVCRSSEREFLAWFPQRLKKGEEIRLERGSLVRLTEELEKRATEVRVKKPEDVYEFGPSEQIRSE